MLDYSPELVSELKTLGLPVHYELFLKQNTEMPCISYQDGYNKSFKEGDTLRYSQLEYKIKIWAREKKTLAQYAVLIDEKMRELGFDRANTSELWLDGIGQLLLTFRALGIENY